MLHITECNLKFARLLTKNIWLRYMSVGNEIEWICYTRIIRMDYGPLYVNILHGDKVNSSYM